MEECTAGKSAGGRPNLRPAPSTHVDVEMRANPLVTHAVALFRVSLYDGDTGCVARVWPLASLALSRALGWSSSGSISSDTVTRVGPTATSMFWCSEACKCCSLRRKNSLAVLTSVLNAVPSMGLGFFLSRPMVHGPTSVGSASPSLTMATAQPSSSSFLMTWAVHPSLCQWRGS